MKSFLGSILVIIFFGACTNKEPAGIFSKKKMENILFDLHIVDGYLSAYPMDGTKGRADYYLSIYEKYHTDSAKVRENLDFYASNPQDLQDIYANVVKRYQKLEDGFQKEEAEKQLETQRLDSIAAKKITDSLNIVKRDSVLNFNVHRDLFVHSPDTSINSLFYSVLNEQRKWEMTFYYFGESNFKPILKSDSLKTISDSLQNPLDAIPNQNE